MTQPAQQECQVSTQSKDSILMTMISFYSKSPLWIGNQIRDQRPWALLASLPCCDDEVAKRPWHLGLPAIWTSAFTFSGLREACHVDEHSVTFFPCHHTPTFRSSDFIEQMAVSLPKLEKLSSDLESSFKCNVIEIAPKLLATSSLPVKCTKISRNGGRLPVSALCLEEVKYKSSWSVIMLFHSNVNFQTWTQPWSQQRTVNSFFFKKNHIQFQPIILLKIFPWLNQPGDLDSWGKHIKYKLGWLFWVLSGMSYAHQKSVSVNLISNFINKDEE